MSLKKSDKDLAVFAATVLCDKITLKLPINAVTSIPYHENILFLKAVKPRDNLNTIVRINNQRFIYGCKKENQQ
jgi:hypothetical protein